MPNTEPNSLPPLVSDWNDWREMYESHVADYRASQLSTVGRDLQLTARLMRLGFIGVNLEAELTYIKNGGN